MAHTLDRLRAAGPSFIPEETHRFSEKIKFAYERNSVFAKAVQYGASPLAYATIAGYVRKDGPSTNRGLREAIRGSTH